MKDFDMHISKNFFFNVLEKRLREYEEAIFGNRKGPGMRFHMTTTLLHNIEELKRTDSLYDLFGSSFWGYGINNICDGYHENSYPDVFEIKKIGRLNKHYESYRNLLLLTFKVENGFLLVSTFEIDSCRFSINSKINRKYELRNFENVQIKKSPGSIIVEFIFKSIPKPIHFQIDTFHFGNNKLCGEQLAKYYFDKINQLVATTLKTENSNAIPQEFEFIKDFVDGIQELQIQDVKQECIRKIKEDNTKDESLFRYFFKICFRMKGYIAEAEPTKGNGRIDLKVSHNSIGNKIIEFKGWWNNDKKEIIKQVCSYLTEFEKDGYIFMINHREDNIIEEYKKIIMSLEMRFVPGSWKKISTKPTGYSYFISEHSFANENKTLYHFIFPIYQ